MLNSAVAFLILRFSKLSPATFSPLPSSVAEAAPMSFQVFQPQGS
jgi:hypothetical protein